MQFQFLRLTGFRNYAELELPLESRVVAVVGPNGTGKTNLIEAFHVLCTARGFAADRETLGHDAPFYLVEGRLRDGGPLAEVSCGYWPGRGKKLICDRRPLPRLSDHLGQLPVVTVLPDDMEVVRSAAKARRQWLDSLLIQFDRPYLNAFTVYDRTLQQRNALLAASATPGGPALDFSLLRHYDEQLAEQGARLVATRAAFLLDFQPVFRERHQAIVGGRETPSLVYAPDCAGGRAEDLLKFMAENRAADRRAGRTLRGPHRDEMLFDLNGKPVRKFGSQGQVKSWVVALRLAQYAWLARQSARPPFLLLDDIFDKLDEERMARIAALLRDEVQGQILVSDASAERLERVWRQAGLSDVQWVRPSELQRT